MNVDVSKTPKILTSNFKLNRPNQHLQQLFLLPQMNA